ncbi:shikimate kinase [Streptomyces sp. NPDC060194]|uniref:shikimate kinase n=1 Tax=Streptomyces sp. NPDC060194 TaxID=3347069 RepID=UPI003647AB24
MTGPLVVLVGPMGVGKSTVGAVLAERLGVGYRDSDEDIVAAEGRAISDIFVDDGEDHFRALERAAVAAALREHTGVLALGGGAVLAEETRELLAGRPVVFLDVEVGEAVRRVGLNQARPLLAVNPRQQWRTLMDARRPLYTEVARAVVATDGLDPDEVADAVLDTLKIRPAGPAEQADRTEPTGQENTA